MDKQPVQQRLRIAVIVIAVFVLIFFGISLVRRNVPQTVETKEQQKLPVIKTSRSSAVIPDDMASVARHHVAFNPLVEVLHDIEPRMDSTFKQDYRTDSGSRARKRQAAGENAFQESELFARLAQDAPFMAPLSSHTEFHQSTLGEEPTKTQ